METRAMMSIPVITVEKEASVYEAAKIMQKHNIGSLPVCDEQGIRGMLTDRDVIVRGVAAGKNLNDTKVTEIMSTNVFSVSPTQNVKEAARIMAKEQIRRLPVVSGSEVVGYVALGDLACVSAGYDMEAAKALSEISLSKKRRL